MKLLYKLLRYIPRPLPVGMAAFNEWSERVISISGHFADQDSMKYALASIILHLDSTTAYKPDDYFVRSMRKAAANQVASQVFQDIKTRQQEAAKAALEAANQVEATTQENVASDGQKA